jgi:SAM-dependent methyltransferase
MEKIAFDENTLAFYKSEAPVYVASGRHGASRYLSTFTDKLTSGAKVLELGCGGGRDALEMIRSGFDVVPTDGTAEIAAQASRLLNRPVATMRFDMLEEVEVYDGIWAGACLLHVPRPALADILSRIHRALKPGGWHGASYKGGGLEGRDKFDRYFNYLSKDDAEHYYQASAEWQNLSITQGVGGGYDGQQGPWLMVLAQRGSA